MLQFKSGVRAIGITRYPWPNDFMDLTFRGKRFLVTIRDYR